VSRCFYAYWNNSAWSALAYQVEGISDWAGLAYNRGIVTNKESVKYVCDAPSGNRDSNGYRLLTEMVQTRRSTSGAMFIRKKTETRTLPKKALRKIRTGKKRRRQGLTMLRLLRNIQGAGTRPKRPGRPFPISRSLSVSAAQCVGPDIPSAEQGCITPRSGDA